MDDYNVNVLSEAKNEYSCRLVNILSPIVIDGIKSIFTDAEKLCIDNDEEDKYLMTFQNFLSRVPKWNSDIIDNESNRIVKVSGCDYLEDLLTCVHITQVKILTSVRVSQQQKKIEIEVPKLNDFIHKIYIQFARRLYKNVYLFEKNILPLSYQKNMRECEILCRESILQVIRDSIPVDKIIRAYIDPVTDEEIIHEITEKEVEKTQEEIEKEEEEERKKLEENEEDNSDKIIADKITLEKKEEPLDNNALDTSSLETKLEKDENELKAPPNTPTVLSVDTSPANKLSFNDTDAVLDMGTNKETNVDAPKTIERLEEISKINEAKRKAEEAEYDDDSDDDDNLTILDSENISLDISDIHDINQPKKLNDDIVLDDIEVLS